MRVSAASNSSHKRSASARNGVRDAALPHSARMNGVVTKVVRPSLMGTNAPLAARCHWSSLFHKGQQPDGINENQAHGWCSMWRAARSRSPVGKLLDITSMMPCISPGFDRRASRWWRNHSATARASFIGKVLMADSISATVLTGNKLTESAAKFKSSSFFSFWNLPIPQNSEIVSVRFYGHL